MTIGLIPDFVASRSSGTLDEFERVAVARESGKSAEAVANEARPHQGVLQSAVRWVRLRARRVRGLLAVAVGLVDALLGCEPTLCAVRERLEVEEGVLRTLRELCELHLEALPAPLGLVPRPGAMKKRKGEHPQSTGPDPPRPSA